MRRSRLLFATHQARIVRACASREHRYFAAHNESLSSSLLFGQDGTHLNPSCVTRVFLGQTAGRLDPVVASRGE